MSDNPLLKLKNLGQSLWLDSIDRTLLTDGSLAKLIEQDGIAGLTSNPAIFQKAFANDDAYQADISKLSESRASVEKIYTELVLEDIANAADLFLPVYQQTDGKDGYVSIEVSPLLARDTEASIQEARDLWARLNRPNIMIKIPGTAEGLSAIRTLLAEGINVNVTLLFYASRYVEVLEMYLQALEQRLEQGLPLDRVASVASFFLSRIDVKLDDILDNQTVDKQQELAKSLRGEIAIASAASAYAHFLSVSEGPRWQKLLAAGAQTQRLLWASTGTKDPAYSDVKYVEALIAPDTVNTLPQKTIDAYRDHGEPALRISESIAKVDNILSKVSELRLDLPALTDELEEEGIAKFIKPYESILNDLKQHQH
jgi:transaldolase